MKSRFAIGKVSLILVFMLVFSGFAAFSPFSSEAADKPLAGKTISFMGDSITTYAGWSDSRPITSPEYANRYGEAYYGPVGGDYHNTELLVSDTWWHQAATELGAEVLMVNSGNSTGVLHASYPSDPDWDQYLKDMLAYKTRPLYMGMGDIKPDIIALYIGSSDVARVSISGFGSINDVDMQTLITQNSDGSFTHKTPGTVAEAYAILFYKLKALYPDAEIYLITVVPNSGGTMDTCKKRLAQAHPFNDMLKGVADYFDAHLVDTLDEFALDPDKDGVPTEEALAEFKSCFNGDPHPNAKGFDVITRRFVKTVLETYPFEKVPATGDTANVWLWSAVTAASFACIFSMVFLKFRKSRKAK